MKPYNSLNREQPFHHSYTSASVALSTSSFPRISLRLKFIVAVFSVHLALFGFLLLYLFADIKINALERREILTSWIQSLLTELSSSEHFQKKMQQLSDSPNIKAGEFLSSSPLAMPLPSLASLSSEQKQILQQSIQNPSSEIVFHSNLSLLLVPIYFGKEFQGVLGLQMFLYRSETLKLIAFIFLLGTLSLIFILYILFNRFILRPLDHLLAVCTRIQRREYPIQEQNVLEKNEIGLILHTLQHLFKENMRYQKELEGKYALATQKIKKSEQHLIVAERLASTGKLVAGIAHEINNPLGGMINAISRLKKKEKLPPQEEYFELIEDGLMRIQEIASQILHFSPRKKQAREVHLNEVLQKAAQFIKHRLQAKNIEIQWNLPEPSLAVFADPLELQQVFQNIILNATDASQPHQAIEIRVQPENEGESLKIEIEDHGIGMDETQLAQAFDLFYTTKEVGKGSGIGLSVVLNIIENHGGTLKMESQKNQGTCVIIYLPTYRKEGS